jgi:hypothetical protein
VRRGHGIGSTAVRVPRPTVRDQRTELEAAAEEEGVAVTAMVPASRAWERADS